MVDPALVELYLKILSIFIMFIILSCEIAIKVKSIGGSSWPFGDLVSGNYLNKVGLPTIIFACFVAVNGHFTIQNCNGCIHLGIFVFLNYVR